MGYALIPLVVSVLLAIQHAVSSKASRASKTGVLAAVLASLVIWRYFPAWLVVATLLQVAAGVYVLIHQRLTPP